MSESEWDYLHQHFNTHLEEVWAGAAGNVHLVWPIVLDTFQERYSPQLAEGGSSLAVLDYGCGVGGLCEEFHQRGLRVLGVDSSPAMVSEAIKHTSSEIQYICGDAFDLPEAQKFHFISAVMVLHFIEDLEQTLKVFHRHLHHGGVLVFAVHNREYIYALQDKEHYRVLSPEKGAIHFDDVSIFVELRADLHYLKMFENCGYRHLFTDYPNFTEEYLKEFFIDRGDTPPQISGPEQLPAKYLVMGFEKARA